MPSGRGSFASTRALQNVTAEDRPVMVEIRPAQVSDARAVAAIHDAAVKAGGATFRTRSRPLADVAVLIADGRPFLVAVAQRSVVGWASAAAYETGNPYYDGVAEVAVYVDEAARGLGTGKALLEALAKACEAAGIFKLVAKVFDTNEVSLRLFERGGYRTVGVHLRHGILRGEWKDVVVLERFLGPAGSERA